ncbi:MAG TPA: isoprenylcysteine carboxylmethyltransferase family protein [Terriglobales bacterium]|nr:isoprenylcysteine carboxylmethyltransferase family protein [Terriglobales bacterium]
MTWSRIARRIRVPLGFLLAIAYIWLARPTWLSLAIGAGIALAGVALRAAASAHVKKNAELTNTGPYAYTRNPLYLGSIIIAAGFAVAALSPWIVLLLAVMFIAIYVPVIRSEEAFLRGMFPNFNEYCSRVPRLIPRFSRAYEGSGTFSRELYLKHREYNALAGTIAMLAALVIKKLWFHS